MSATVRGEGNGTGGTGYPDYPLSMMPRLMWSAVYVFESDVQNVEIFLTRAGATAAILEDISDSGWNLDEVETHLDDEQLPDHWIADEGTVEWHVFASEPKP